MGDAAIEGAAQQRALAFQPIVPTEILPQPETDRRRLRPLRPLRR